MSRPPITSRQNPRVKDAAKLRLRRQRERQGLTLIDGGREIARAVAAGIELVEAFVCEPLCEGAEARTAVDQLRQTRADVAEVTEEVFEKLCFGDRTDGVIAVARTPRGALADLRLPERPLVAVLEAVEKPGNLGAVLRSADGAGIDAVIVADSATDLYNPAAIRASMGTIFSMPTCVATTAEVLSWLAANRLPAFAARVDAELLYTEVDYRSGGAIVLGSEAAGLSATWQDARVTGIKLPMRGAADSLNVSATAAVLFYEAQRQRS